MVRRCDLEGKIPSLLQYIQRTRYDRPLEFTETRLLGLPRLMTQNDDLLVQDLRRHDYERYLLSLFAPAARRPALWAVLALNLELSRIPDLVSQPVLGQMRLAWWRDAVAKALGQSESGGNPVLQGLIAAGRAGMIEANCLDHLIDGHERLVLRDPEASLSTLGTDAGEIGVALARLRLRALGLDADGHDDRARRQGIAWEIMRRLRMLPRAASIGQVMIPIDLAISAPEDDEDPSANRAALKIVTTHFVDMMAEQLKEAPGSRITRAHLPALGDRIVIARYLARLHRCGDDPADSRLMRPDGLAPMGLAWSWMRGTL